MKLNLKRPLAFFDLETTGVNVGTDRIVEIAILKAMPDASEVLYHKRINPQMPIPLEASLIHGIYDADVAESPIFTDVAEEIITFLGDADLAGYNSNKFDIPMLLEEILRSGFKLDMSTRKFVDVQNIFHQMEQRTLKAAYKFYCDKELLNAHSAEADIRATYEVLLAQIERYDGKAFEDRHGKISYPVKNDVEALYQFTNLNKSVDYAGRIVFNEKGEETINFGKHKGKTLEDIFDSEPSYYAWMMQGDFPMFTKQKLEEVWQRWSQKKESRKQAVKTTGARQEYRTKKNDEPAKPLTGDMLDQLRMKFGK